MARRSAFRGLRPVIVPVIVVAVLDRPARGTYTAVTPAKGGFMRLTGRVEVKPEA